LTLPRLLGTNAPGRGPIKTNRSKDAAWGPKERRIDPRKR